MAKLIANSKTLIAIIFVAAAAIRIADVLRPINQASWRESDLGSVARNYVLEDMNFFYPRIDWRGQTPGYTEMEFPIYPFLIAVTYKIFGIHENIGRIWSFLFSLGTLFFFLKLIQKYLDDTGQIFAFSFFAFHPMIVEFSTAIQPEGLMICFYVASVFYFTEWIEKEDNKDFWLALVTTAFAVLAKATAAHMGLLFGVLLFQKYRLQVFRQWRVWIFGASTLLPAAAWYSHARTLWLNYGNSLGVSNEYPWVGWDFFTNPYFIKGILRSEVMYVWVIFGLIVGVFAVWRGFSDTSVKLALIWLVSVFAMYFLASRTTADEWARYYHIFSIPPAALLFGSGIERLKEYVFDSIDRSGETLFRRSIRPLVSTVVGVGALCTLLLEAKQVRAGFLDHRVTDESLACVRQLRPKLQTGNSLILVSGSDCLDPDGYFVAYNASFMFYWLERKGFNICVQDQSPEKVQQFRDRGAKYFVAQKSYMDMKPGFEAEMRLTFPVVDECSAFVTFDLTKNR